MVVRKADGAANIFVAQPSPGFAFIPEQTAMNALMELYIYLPWNARKLALYAYVMLDIRMLIGLQGD